MEPAISDVAEPVTRLRMADEVPGWTKVTLLSLPMEKPLQLTMARSDPCVMVMDVPLVPIAT